jgi:hypothetical protein
VQNDTIEDIQIHARPGMFWIIAAPIVLVNINNGNAKTTLGQMLILIILVLAGGLTIWMKQVPHITVTSAGMTIRYIIGGNEVPFADIASWGTTLGTLYVRRKNGKKVNVGMFLYLDQADRQRLFAVLQERGIPTESK